MARTTNPDWSLSKSLGLLGKLLFVIALLVQISIALFNRSSQAKPTTPTPLTVNVTVNNQSPSPQGRGQGRRNKKVCPCACPESAVNCDVPANGATTVKAGEFQASQGTTESPAVTSPSSPTSQPDSASLKSSAGTSDGKRGSEVQPSPSGKSNQ